MGQLHYCKLGLVLLQIGAAITNQNSRCYKIGQLLQTGAKCITNWGRYYKLGQLWQIGASQMVIVESWGRVQVSQKLLDVFTYEVFLAWDLILLLKFFFPPGFLLIRVIYGTCSSLELKYHCNVNNIFFLRVFRNLEPSYITQGVRDIFLLM